MTAMSAADQIEAGILTVFPAAKTIKIPMADGGKGTAETYLMISGGELIWHAVMDPCNRNIRASRGAEKIVIGLGGSATIKAGVGSLHTQGGE
ncbi:hypothetical protein EHS13_23805 [Paenibacillus psychroresistens]|uniref:Uncharacterized protein n=2 Tax=Paenibacillus psychroresistens TaxID=1778678 RepID=A0A6B8RN14_9BACL|nr:glycerate kinase [Paenibacillus psychroresistens]QGQ97700.1 hypothetical protein EHS13_23805 [Paenibacillus psychroresistens]